MEKLFTLYMREKQYLLNVSPKTLIYYRNTFSVYKRMIGDVMPDKANIKELVVKMQQAGLADATVNKYIRGFNSFFTWLHENEHTKERFKIKKSKEEQKIVKTFTDEQLKKIFTYKPKDFYEHRLLTIILLAIDTGCRIEELLTLTRENLDFDNLLVSVIGKGNKARVVPISLEGRKVAFKFLARHNYDLVFPTKDGHKVTYCNALRDLKELCKKLEITGVRCSFHNCFRTRLAV